MVIEQQLTSITCAHWDDDCDCGDVDCEGCRMKRRINAHRSGIALLDYYFPISNRDTIVMQDGMQVERADCASCVRCGVLVIQSHWDNHIQWHTNAIR